MSEILFSSLQFEFAQSQTWVMKHTAKHKILLNIVCIVYDTVLKTIDSVGFL